MSKQRKEPAVAPVVERDAPVDYMAWVLALASAAVCVPFVVAMSLFGCACAVKAARLLYDVASTLGA